MTIIYPSTKTIKDEIRNAIGQTVTFLVQGDPTSCPVCSGSGYYDGVNELSLDPFCTTCSGKYWITSDTTTDVVAHVRWRVQDEPNMQVAGEIPVGDCSVTIGYDALGAIGVAQIKEIYADSRRLQIYRTIYRGVPDRDRIRFVCREFAKQ